MLRHCVRPAIQWVLRHCMGMIGHTHTIEVLKAHTLTHHESGVSVWYASDPCLLAGNKQTLVAFASRVGRSLPPRRISAVDSFGTCFPTGQLQPQKAATASEAGNK